MDALIKKNYPIALKWFLMGASRGDSSAQFQLGNIFADGKGLPQDFLQAYKWFDIAAATHGACIDRLPPGSRSEDNQKEINYRDSVARKMTQAQISEAQRLAREWKPSGSSWAWDARRQQYIRAKSACDGN